MSAGACHTIGPCVATRFQCVAFPQVHDRGAAFAQPLGALGDRVEHRLNVRRAARNDAENVGHRGLLLERFLGFVEEPHVLDRDYGLVGEGL